MTVTQTTTAPAMPEWLVETILRQAAEGGDPEATARAHGISLARLQGLCGSSEDGHQWESDSDDYRQWSGCVICEAIDDREWGDL